MSPTTPPLTAAREAIARMDANEPCANDSISLEAGAACIAYVRTLPGALALSEGEREALAHGERPASQYGTASLLTLFGEMCARVAMYGNKAQFDRAKECEAELLRRLSLQSPPSVSGEWIAELKEALRNYGPELFPALRRVAAAQWETWLPIESAPKDGTRVVLAWGGKSLVGFYLDNSATQRPWQGWRVPSMELCPPGQPTHFQYLPPPPHAAPVSKEGEGNG